MYFDVMDAFIFSQFSFKCLMASKTLPYFLVISVYVFVVSVFFISLP